MVVDAARCMAHLPGVDSVVVVLFAGAECTSVRLEFGSRLVGQRGIVVEGQGEEPGEGRLVCRNLAGGGISCPRWCGEGHRGRDRRLREGGPCWLREHGWGSETDCSIVPVVRRDVPRTPSIGFRRGMKSRGGATSRVRA